MSGHDGLRATTVARAQVARIAAQIGSELMDDTATHVNRFKVASRSSSSFHTVSQRVTAGEFYGRWECSCRGWTMHKNRKCYHLDNILGQLAALNLGPTEVDPAVLAMLAAARTAHLDLVARPITITQQAVTRQLDL